jgi:hypothetical protein
MTGLLLSLAGCAAFVALMALVHTYYRRPRK